VTGHMGYINVQRYAHRSKERRHLAATGSTQLWAVRWSGGPVVRFNAVKFSFMTVAIVPKAEIAGLLKEAFNV
jgi:hypothetical protein